MPISSYQVEWLIHQRRRWRGLVRMVERALFAAPDKIELSTEGRMQAVEQHPGPKAGAEQLWPIDLADRTVYPEPVAYELERRAGSFMRPKQEPSIPHRPIPRVDLWAAADVGKDGDGEEDES